MEKYKHLNEVNDNWINNEKKALNKLKLKEDPYYIIPYLEGANATFSIYSVYISHNALYAKNYFYKAARIAEYMSIKYDRRIIDSGINQISYALLSDNVDLIQRYSILRNTKNHELNIGFQLPNAMQNILKGDTVKLEENIRNLERFVQVPRFKCWASLVDVFKGFLAGDFAAIELGLQQMLQTHLKRNKDPLVPKFLSIDTAGLCKLAWIKGYEIDLKSSLVPIELMPVKPLDRYEDYDFLV
ncbi:MAG: hypothetical protein EOO47_27820 [Flavobacterium sp.]|nr:MAG: hypothetical protein EOO47_27820 [Flavobacterium sp.]